LEKQTGVGRGSRSSPDAGFFSDLVSSPRSRPAHLGFWGAFPAGWGAL
jgi:hypothetical protein